MQTPARFLAAATAAPSTWVSTSLACGENAQAWGTESTAIGKDSSAFGFQSTAIGNGANAEDQNAVASRP